MYHPWYNPGMVFPPAAATGPLIPTWTIQLAAVLCLITAAVCGRVAERDRDALYGALSVLCLFSFTGLVGVLLYRLTR